LCARADYWQQFPMNLLIIEDEPRAANRLERMIKEVQPKAHILAKIPSVKAAIAWFLAHKSPDIIFMDVRLEDGESFDILSQAKIDAPIVFCTAHADYALRAFEANSIDYLLKPVVSKDLQRALEKYEKFTGFRMKDAVWPNFAADGISSQRPYKKQFLVAVGQRFTPVLVQDIILVEAYLKGARLIDKYGKEWPLDDPLSTIETMLDPASFMAVSRQNLVRLDAVRQLKARGRFLDVWLEGCPNPVPVSRARVKALKLALAQM